MSEKQNRDQWNEPSRNNAGLNPFYSTPDGFPTIASQADFAQALREAEGSDPEDLVELDRYWAVYPYSFISICKSKKHGEKRYIVVEPHTTEEEAEILSYLIDKIETKIRKFDTQILTSDDQHRRAVIREAAIDLMKSYNMLDSPVIEEAHSRSGIATDEFEHNESNIIKERIDRLVFSDDGEIDEETVSCRENAYSYGVTGESDYLPIISTVSGHPVVDQPTEEADDFDTTSQTTTDEGSNSMLPNISILNGENESESDSDDEEKTWDEPNIELDDMGSDEEDEKLWADGGAVQLSQDSTETATENVSEMEKLDELKLPSKAVGDLAIDAAIDDDSDIHPLTEYQVYKILYYIEREFVGYKKIDAIKNDDKNVEDMRVSGYHKPVFVYHKNHGQMQTNVVHHKEDLDDFITTLAQFSGEELSRRQPKTEAKLPDGSRAELEKGYETSDTGSNYTIRQFKQVPHTPIDLINWDTYGIDQMAILWLFIQNDKSALIAGGTGAGKTTTLNALSLFIPSESWIVSIEDTQEIDLPHKNWTANTTRDSGDLTDEDVDIDEFELLKSALRKRPDNIILGEVRGREAFELLQSVRTGHPGLTTFHAPSFNDVVDRMTSEPIEVPLPLLTAIDVVLIQGETRVDGERVRRSKNIVEITGYTKEDNDEETQGVLKSKNISKWDAQNDTQQLVAGESKKFADIAEENGWSGERQRREILERQVVLAGLIKNGINNYSDVSAVLQAAMLNSEQVLKHIANGTLKSAVGDFGEDLLNIELEDNDGEVDVDRPDPSGEVRNRAEQIIEREKNNGVLEEYVE